MARGDRNDMYSGTAVEEHGVARTLLLGAQSAAGEVRLMATAPNAAELGTPRAWHLRPTQARSTGVPSQRRLNHYPQFEDWRLFGFSLVGQPQIPFDRGTRVPPVDLCAVHPAESGCPPSSHRRPCLNLSSTRSRGALPRSDSQHGITAGNPQAHRSGGPTGAKQPAQFSTPSLC
jgi:hypothetical protein